VRKKSADILIAGGGPAGCGAAIAASSLGAKVTLIERYGFLGGMATAGLVYPWMTSYAGRKKIIAGVFEKVINKLKKENAFKDGSHFGGLHHCFDPEILKYVLMEMLIERKVEILFHSFISGAKTKNKKIEGLEVVSKSGKEILLSNLIIDATGDGDVAYYAGADYEKGRKEDGLMQPATLNFRMGGVNVKKMPEREEINKLYLQAKKEGKIGDPRENLLWFETLREDQIHFNTTRVLGIDGTKRCDLSAAEIEARRQVMELVKFLRKKVPGFENSYLLITAPQIGIRETRRIIGEYILSEADLLQARKPSDAIALGSYGLDIHNPKGEGTIIKKLKKGAYYGIPYRCLIPKKIEGLIIAGRPISATHAAHSSVRIQPICYATGQAAGSAAALALSDKTTPRKVNVEKLQKVLKREGAKLN